ncbi:MAG: hypothetical protein ACI8W8_003392 [Rhodothermales bacterium]|jgi:hypothetical protein
MQPDPEGESPGKNSMIQMILRPMILRCSDSSATFAKSLFAKSFFLRKENSRFTALANSSSSAYGPPNKTESNMGLLPARYWAGKA